MPKLLLNTLRLHFAPGPEGHLPEKLLVAKWGENASVKGAFIVNEETARELPLNQKRGGFDTVDLDFEHNTVPGSPAFVAGSEPRKRAAFGPLEVVEGEGVYLHTAGDNWTPEGRDAVLGKHYADLSPTILTNEKGEVIFIHSVALARQGATEGLELQLNSSDPLAALQTLSSQPTSHTMEYKEILLTLLGLTDKADLTKADIHTAAVDLRKQITAEPAKPAAAELPAEITEQLQTLSTGLEDLQKKLATQEREGLIADAIREGKLVPQSVQDLPTDKLKNVLEELPAGVVPLEKRTPDGLKAHSVSITTPAEAAAEAEVKSKLNISDEDWEKHNS